jgi:ADP-ribose pyrophosphatase
VVKDRWLALRADTYRTPADQIVDSCYVFEYRAWVNVVALTAAQEIVLVRQFRPGIGRTILELPGGTTDPEDASPEAAVRRELLEETGYTGERFAATGCYSPNPASHTNLVHCFLATDVARTHDPRPDDNAGPFNSRPQAAETCGNPRQACLRRLRSVAVERLCGCCSDLQSPDARIE